MRSTLATLLTTLFLASPIQAATEILTPDQFETYANGKTLYFAQRGRPFGVEQYLKDRRSIWRYSDGTCLRGIWYARQDLICFVYENSGDPQCWNFLHSGTTYSARIDGGLPENDLEVIFKDTTPVTCKAPDLGV